MMIVLGPNGEIGVTLAGHLGLALTKREGHDLAGPCITCKSSDAFRLHMQTGVAQCYSCGGKWSPFQLAEVVTGDREQAKNMLVEIGLFKPGLDGNGQAPHSDPVESIAKQKRITADSLRAFGAKVVTPYSIQIPCYGPDGKPCTAFTLSTKVGTQANKGLFAKGKPAGLFFPHDDNGVRLPKSEETWQLVEGPKDAAALHGMGFLACGLNTCRLAAKFARLFVGTRVILIPDRDRAGEEGSQYSTRVLRGVAESIAVAALPAEFKESKGADVRDILRQTNGEQILREAIDDAVPAETEQQNNIGDSHDGVAVEIDMPEGEPVTLTVSPAGKKPQRLIVAQRGDVSHRDRINTDSSISRDRFIKKLAAKLEVDFEIVGPRIDPKLTELAD